MTVTTDKKIEITQNVSAFNMILSENDKIDIINQLEPINDLLQSDSRSAIHLYESNLSFYGEGIVFVGDKFGSARTEGTSLHNVVEKLIPKLIRATNTKNLFPRIKKLSMNDNSSELRN